MTRELCILTLNVQGLRDKSKRTRLYEWIKNQKFGIAFVQETHFTIELCKLVENEISEFALGFHSVGTSNSGGVSILINKQLPINVAEHLLSNDGRSLFMNIEIDDSMFTLANIYAPNDTKHRNTFFKKQIQLLREFKTGTLIIGGDYNELMSICDRRSKNKNVQSIKSKCTFGLKQLIKNYKLKDIWRIKNGNKNLFTWRRKSVGNFSRIDYFLIEDDILDIVRNCDIRPAQISSTDHMAVALKLEKIRAQGCGKLIIVF